MPGNEEQQFSVPLDEIEGVTLRFVDGDRIQGRTLRLSGKRLVISTDQQDYTRGSGVPETALDWLRRYIISATAHA